MGRAAVAIGMMWMASAVAADEVYLRSGGRLSGIVVSQNASSVEIEVGAGVVTVPRSIIERIVQAPSALSQYHSRARVLSPTDAAGWLELAEFARAAGLSGQAREGYRRVLALQPDNATARRALGYARVGDEWLTEEEAMAARGYVWFEGDWVTPIQRDAVLSEREASRRERLEAERSRAAVAEAEARAREAEARARAAEAEAKRAEEERERGPFVVGPAGWGWGYTGPVVVGSSGCCTNPYGHSPGRCPHRRSRRSGLSIEWRSSPAPATPAPTSPPTRHAPASATH